MLFSTLLKHCWLRIIGICRAFGAVALGAGCSMVSLGYNRLHDLGMLWLNRQLALTEAQSAQTRADMADLLAWHRSTTPDQRSHALSTLRAHEAELRALAQP